MTPVILLRNLIPEVTQEYPVAEKYFPVYRLRTKVPADSLVISRYSALPHYSELEQDLKNLGSTLVNTFQQHFWIASFDYYEEVKDYTPKTWKIKDFYKTSYPGPFVVKGATNSKKSRWSSLMFAKTKIEAVNIGAELTYDGLISQQDIIYREYVPLKTFEVDSISGIPYANEHRLFFYQNKLLSHGYYWSCAENVNVELSSKGLAFAQHLANIVSKFVNFFVLDIAELADKADKWILIEINDGQMAGLSENKPEALYKNLKEALIS